jgi:hypothetical protein
MIFILQGRNNEYLYNATGQWDWFWGDNDFPAELNPDIDIYVGF